MSTNTLETAYTNGDIIDASHVNEITLALTGEFVGRNSNGIPTQGQNLGTQAIQWGNLYTQNIILNGLALDTSQITSLPNRIVSGASRSLSSQPDFLRADGTALAFDILGASVDLVLSINTQAVSVNTDINTTGITAAPAANNTAAINNTSIVNDLYAGEEDASVNELIIDAAGTEFTGKVGEEIAFLTANNEIVKGFLKSTTLITNCFRGYYFNDSGNPIVRQNLSNNDLITLLNIGYVFIEDNGTTVDVSYLTPVISYNAPNSPSTGQYWYDISNNVWKRYSGTAFEIINRMLIGEIVADDTAVIASRSYDFTKAFSEFNNVEVEIDSTEIIKSKTEKNKVNVYGTEVTIDLTKLSWNITTDLETGLVEAADTDYYLYLDADGQEIISNEKPYLRNDLKGKYHPYHSWRCVGLCFNDSSNNILLVSDFFNEKNIVVQDRQPSGTGGGSLPLATNVRVLNTKLGDAEFAELESNQIIILAGEYDFNGHSPAYATAQTQAQVYNISDSEILFLGSSTESSPTGSTGTTASFLDSSKIVFDKTKILEVRMQNASNGGGTQSGGFAANRGNEEIYTTLKINKRGK